MTAVNAPKQLAVLLGVGILEARECHDDADAEHQPQQGAEQERYGWPPWCVIEVELRVWRVVLDRGRRRCMRRRSAGAAPSPSPFPPSAADHVDDVLVELHEGAAADEPRARLVAELGSKHHGAGLGALGDEGAPPVAPGRAPAVDVDAARVDEQA